MKLIVGIIPVALCSVLLLTNSVAAQTDGSQKTEQDTAAQAESKQTQPATVSSNQESQEDSKSQEDSTSVAPADGNSNSDSDQDTESNTESESDAQGTETRTSSAASLTEQDAEKETFDLTFDDLKFEMEKGSKFDRSLLTDKINSYNNNVISVRGFIRPSFTQKGLTKFIFVRDNKECCFGPGAALYDCILVRLTKGSSTDFTVRPVTIEGTFSLKEYNGPDGKVWSIYRMNNTEMK